MRCWAGGGDPGSKPVDHITIECSPYLPGTHAVALLEAFLRARDADAEGDPVCLANVHRLDKSTSGVLLLSKSPKAAAALGREFKARRVKKLYWAALYGRVDAPMVRQLSRNFLVHLSSVRCTPWP